MVSVLTRTLAQTVKVQAPGEGGTLTWLKPQGRGDSHMKQTGTLINFNSKSNIGV